MKSIDQWLAAYGKDHKHPINQKIHKVCVPLIMFSLLGLLWSVPKPSFFLQQTFFNWSSLFCLGCLVFYVLLDKTSALVMFIASSLMLVAVSYIANTSYLFPASLSIFILAWIGQFIGHKIEGQKPSFFEDIQFLLIGPLWVIKSIYRF